MNDDFLKHLKEPPRPGFATDLRGQLREQDAAAGEDHEPSGTARWLRPTLAAAAGIGVIVLFSVSPALRASAQAFLDLFRVRNFVAVTVDPTRMHQLEQLHEKNLDLKAILGDNIQELEKPGPERVFTDAGAAGQAAGMSVRLPSSLPNNLAFDTMYVHGQGAARITVNARKLREMLDIIGLSDVKLPDHLDGAQATMRMPASVVIPLKHEGQHVMFMQARSPEVSLPPGLDIQQLGEAGLRIIGMPETEAHRFAQTIDWRTTLLLPLPPNASSFSEVDVQGHKGLLVTMTDAGEAVRDRPPHVRPRRHRAGSMLMWSDADKVYALAGNAPGQDLLLIASSLR